MAEGIYRAAEISQLIDRKGLSLFSTQNSPNVSLSVSHVR